MLSAFRVLLVEDDDDYRDLLRAILRRAGATVRSVATVDEALWDIEDFLPDVIVSDLIMPERDGFELMEAVSSRPIPVVAVSGGDPGTLTRRVKSAGFAAFLPKPISAANLIETVRRVTPMPSAGRSKVGDGSAP